MLKRILLILLNEKDCLRLFLVQDKKRFCLFERVVFILNVPIENIMYVGFDSKYEKSNEELRSMLLLSSQNIMMVKFYLIKL